MFEFNEDDRNRIRKALDIYDPERVERFLAFWEVDCGTYLLVRKNPRRPRQIRENEAEVLEACEAAIRKLRRVATGDLPLETQTRFPVDRPENAKAADAFYFHSGVVKNAVAAHDALCDFVEHVEARFRDNAPLPFRRDPADADRFAERLARLFQTELLSLPTTSKDGPFSNVLHVTFEVLQRHDPTLPALALYRRVSQAIQKIRE